jgi:hypothetical protein
MRYIAGTLRHGHHEEVRLEKLPRIRVSHVLMLKTYLKRTWREAASAHSQGCASFGVRAGVRAIPVFGVLSKIG